MRLESTGQNIAGRPCRGWRVLVVGCVLLWAAGSERAIAQPLSAEEFRQIGAQGFGDRGNSYAWAMAWFKGKVYIGTNHNFSCLTRSIVSNEPLGANAEVPLECPEELLDNDFRGRIYTYDPATNVIELVHISPTIKVLVSDGSEVDAAIDLGYRTMTVMREPDGTEALYVGAFVTAEIAGPPPRILRSTDGRTFSPLQGAVLNNPNYASFRSLTVYKDRLYVIAIGKTGTPTHLLESSDPASGVFRVVNPPNFGDPVNIAVFELEVFAGHLYVGTATATAGFQLLKTQAVGQPPYQFQKVLAQGAYRGAENQNVVSLQAFRDHLYVGTGINFVGLGFFDDVNPAPAEMLRVSADDRWDIVCGEARDTPDGMKSPVAGRDAGCGNPFTGYIWRMVEHDGVLYMGTFDLSVVAQYLDGITIEQLEEGGLFEAFPEIRPLIELTDPTELGDMITAFEGGFDLWASEDGDTWKRISRSGFGDTYSYGVRSFLSTPVGLFLGSANPFFGFRLFLGQRAGRDSDGDGRPDVEDNCPLTWNLNQMDTDGDGIGDACDDDDDNDCIADVQDTAPLVRQPAGPDTDNDGIPDACDGDADDDGVPNAQDNCPLDPNNDQADEVDDGVGDVCTPPVAPGDGGLQPETPSPGAGDDDGAGDDADEGLPRVSPCGSGAGTAALVFVMAWPMLRLGSRRRT